MTRHLTTARLLFTAILLTFSWNPPSAGAVGTLDQVKARGTLRCGVSDGIVGFSQQEATGRWSGLDVDFCRAVAAAALGNPEKVTYVPLRASTRFPALRSGAIDLLVRHASWSLNREAGLKLQFAGVLFYDGQSFMVPAASPATSVAHLNGATICIEKGTSHQRFLSDHFATFGLTFTPLVIDSAKEVAEALFAGRCEAYTSNVSQLAAARLRAPDGKPFRILPELISKSPLGPVVRNGDDEWLTLVRWVLFALIAAEENSITRENVRTFREDTSNPVVRRILGADREFGDALGVDPEWAMRVVESGGNYGELFERNLGNHSPLKLERQLNRLWTHGGLMYSPPFR